MCASFDELRVITALLCGDDCREDIQLSILLNGYHIYGSPFFPTVLPAPTSAGHCTVHGDGASIAVVGQSNEFTIVACDAWDQPRGAPPAVSPRPSCRHTHSATSSLAVTLADSDAHVTHTVTHVLSSTDVTVTRIVSPTRCCAGLGGDTWFVHLTGPLRLTREPIDHGNGVYTVSYVVDTEHPDFASGLAKGSVSVNLVNPVYVHVTWHVTWHVACSCVVCLSVPTMLMGSACVVSPKRS